MNIYKILTDITLEENIKRDELLSRHTTFKTGGAADFFVSPHTMENVAGLIAQLEDNKISYYVLGNGSNVLAPDEGFRGVIVYIGEKLSDIKVHNDVCVTAGAGAMLGATARVAAANSLTGMETLAGIPGSVGGGVYMNAGAYCGEVKDVILSAKVCDKSGNIITLQRDEMDLSYRHSIMEEKGYTVLEATFKLEIGDKEDIKNKIMELAIKRKEKQPLEYPSAGSTFKRPEGHFAGKLIMDAGLSGFSVGGACVSPKHCGFVVNTGGATSDDIKHLMDEVSRMVFDKYKVKLEPEVRIL